MAATDDTADDATLLAQVTRGDQAAFARLVARHQRTVVAVAYAIVADRALAHDLAQEAFMKAWRSAGEVRDPTRTAAWLCGIVRFLARDHRRLERRRQALLDQAGASATAPAPLAPSPDDALAARQDEALLAHVVAQLPASYREPILLHYVAGSPVAHIAAALAVSEDVIKQRLARGRRALDVLLAAAGVDQARFASAAVVLVPTEAFTEATVRVATTAAPTGAATESFMRSHPMLTAAVAAVLVAGGGVAIATAVGADDRAPTTAPTAAPTTAAAPARAAVGPAAAHAAAIAANAAARPTDAAAVRAAIAAARARASATGEPSPAAPAGAAAAGPAPITYDFAGEAIAASGLAPALTPSPNPIPGLNKASIRRGLVARRPAVRACYLALREREPDAEGVVATRLVVDGEPGIGGVVREVEVVADGTSLDDGALHDCLIAALLDLTLPAPAAGATVEIHVPYTFAP